MNHELERQLLIARPRGFCAGVERAVGVVDRLLEIQGAPVYVRKEIVHNQAVVEGFRKRGVVFIEELDEAPDGALVVFSAHGVSPTVRAEAERRGLRSVDATCPLVTRVHRNVLKHTAQEHPVVLVGHGGHDEVVGTMGEALDHVHLIETVEDVQHLDLPRDVEVAYVTQTTLGVDETEGIIAALHSRFPRLIQPGTDDICYATTNRQDAVKALVAAGATHVFVVGSKNSSNSVRLCEVARGCGVSATLVDGADEVDSGDLDGHRIVGLTAGASAPEELVRAVADRLGAAGWLGREVEGVEENVKFKMPRELSDIS